MKRGKKESKRPIVESWSCHEIGKLLASTLDLDEILNHIMNKVGEIVNAENWSLLLLDNATNELEFKVVVGLKKELISDIRIPVGEGVAGIAAETGESIYITNAVNDPRIYREVDERTGFVTKSLVCLPLNIHGRTLGVIEVVNIPGIEEFMSTDLHNLEVLVDYAAIAIENSQYFSEIKKMSITDEYTGLYNVRYMHNKLDQLIQLHEENNEQFAVVFIDIDNFKSVVDTYGHLAGSQVLKEVGQIIKANLPAEHILCKYGGDEFVIIYLDIDRRKAISITEHIQSAIRSSKFLLELPDPVTITASFGIAIFPEDAKDKKELLLSADNRMYTVKRSTKNGICTG
jgi:diguanylate cyclase (GGDEF)-like protein